MTSPDVYFYRLPQTGYTLRVVTQEQPNGETPQASLEQPDFRTKRWSRQSTTEALNALAEKLEKVAAEIRSVAAELPQ